MENTGCSSTPSFRDVDRASRFYDTMRQEQMVAGYMRELEQEEEKDAMKGLDTLEKIESAPDSLATRKDRPAYMVRIGQEIALNGMEDVVVHYDDVQDWTSDIGANRCHRT